MPSRKRSVRDLKPEDFISKEPQAEAEPTKEPTKPKKLEEQQEEDDEEDDELGEEEDEDEDKDKDKDKGKAEDVPRPERVAQPPIPKHVLRGIPKVYSKKENLTKAEVIERKNVMLAFMKLYARNPDASPSTVGAMVDLPPLKAHDYLNHFIAMAVKFGNRNDFFDAVKYAYNHHLTDEEYDEMHLDDSDIKVLLPLVDKFGTEHKRIARMEREGETIPVQGQGQGQLPKGQQTLPVYDETLKNYNNPSSNYNSTMTQQQQQEQSPEEGILTTILSRYNVNDKKIPDVVGMWRQLRLTYIAQPQAFYNMLRTQVGEVQAKGIAEAFIQACGQNIPMWSQENVAMANSSPMSGIFPTQPIGQGMGGSVMFGQQGQQQQQGPYNPQQMQWMAAGIPPPPGPNASPMDMWLWKQIYDSWQEEQRFKRASQQNVNKILGQASGNGSNDNNMMLMMMMNNQNKGNIMFLPETRPDGSTTWKPVPNPNPMPEGTRNEASEMTKAVISSLTQIASTVISNKNNPSPVEGLFTSIVTPMLNKSLNNIDQIEGIKKMIEVGNMLQKPHMAESPEIAQQKIDAKFALWREELEWRKTVREWDQQDRREHDAAKQQDKYLSLFQEWGKDAVPQLMAIFGRGLIGALGPKMSAEQLAAAAQQKYMQQQQQQMQQPGYIGPMPNGMPGMQFNPFQGPGGMPEGLPPQVIAQMQQDAMMQQQMEQQQRMRQQQHQQQPQEINPFQQSGGYPMQQPGQPMPMQPFMPGQQQLQAAPGPEQFLHLNPNEIDDLYDNVHGKKKLLEEYENNLRIAKNRQQTTPIPVYAQQQQQGSGIGMNDPRYYQQQQPQVQQPPEQTYGDEAEYEIMPANSMTEAEEAQRSGDVTPNDIRNAVSQNVDMGNMGGYPQQNYEQPGSGYENVNWQAMQETDPTENQLPVQQQQQTGNQQQRPRQAVVEGMTDDTGLDSMPELNQSLEPIPGTEMQGTGATPSTAAGKAANQVYEHKAVGQGQERQIKRPTKSTGSGQ